MRPVLLATVAQLAAASLLAAQQWLTPYQRLGRDILRELVEANTEYSRGSTSKAA